MTTFDEFLSSFNLDNNKEIQFEYFVKWFLNHDSEWILEGIKKAIDDDKPYDEYLMLSKEDRKAWDDGNLFF